MTRVAVYGNSVALAGVEVALGQFNGIEILPSWNGPGDTLPDVLIFDTTASEVWTVVDILRCISDVRLIGLDVSQSIAMALTERKDIVITMHDLAKVITGGKI